MTGPRILVLGAGGVGGYFGGRLAHAGADVTFLVRPARRDQLQSDGLRITSALGDLRIPVQTATAGERRPPFDIVVLTCKAYDLPSAVEAIAPAVGPKCIIVPLLNGMSHLDVLDGRFGRDHVIGGSCAIDVTLAPDGTVTHSGTLQRLVFGERDGQRTPRTLALADVLGRTSLQWEHSDAILLRMWEKLVMLSVLAAMTCLFRGNVAEVVSAPGGRDAAVDALSANARIASLEGFPPSAESLALSERRLTDPNGRWSASMLRDMESGRQVEADHVIGFMLEKASRHNVSTPLLSMAYTHLKTYERRRADGRLPRPA
jgi:2-dehydropantoate 2-reductase